MSCYLRHLKAILDEAGVELTRENREQIDRAIHQAVSVGYRDCPTTWKRLKQQVLNDEKKRREFIRRLQDALE